MTSWQEFNPLEEYGVVARSHTDSSVKRPIQSRAPSWQRVYEPSNHIISFDAKGISIYRHKLKATDRAIDRAERILGIANYILHEPDAPTTYSWHTMTSFLRRLAVESEVLSIGSPIVSTADDMSTDLYWKLENVDLLINFPKDSIQLPSYFGMSNSGSEISGYIADDFSPTVFFEWLSATG